MDLWLIIAGLAIGLATSAPIGAVNLIVIRTALNYGFMPAFFAGLGAVAADMVMAGAAAFGLQPFQQQIENMALPLQIIGGLLLVTIGVRAARTSFAVVDLEPTPHAERLGLTFSLSITNPGLILGFIAIFSSMGVILNLDSAPWRPAMVLMGVALGGALWWLLLSKFMSQMKTRISPALLEKINRWSGVFVAAFGFVLLLQIF